ncbi:MAG: sugar O-acetyltransferase [Ruminococcaceae bacterium]|nr:sugar O-acetyltransferase [Oscillospiraceae bacterium]
MTEHEKCMAGLMYDANYAGREEEHLKCMELCYDFNHLRPSDAAGREELIRKIFHRIGKSPYIEPNLWVSFGTNIEAGDYFYANHDCVFLDPGKITFGNYVFIGPQCGFYTAHHPLHSSLRNQFYEYAKPITIGDNVWIGGGSIIMPGVTIGSNVVIGGGSIVCHDIPDNVLACGNPCRIIREITNEDLISMH